MLSVMRKAIDDYQMIEDGDRIAVGVSGGKDSLCALSVLAEMRRFYPRRYELRAIMLDMGLDREADFSAIEAYCAAIDVPLTIVRTEIGPVIFDVRKESNPCALCAKMRRGALHDAALREGCKKVVLGHHFDDVVETFVLSLFFEGRLSCFSPVTWLDRTGITLLRPMIYIPEREIKSFVRRMALPVYHNPCPANGNTKRQYVKELLATLSADNRDLREKIFGALCRSGIAGWKEPVVGRRTRAVFHRENDEKAEP
ncbi:tRNA 2-thiocytidine biosynthesis TtcA family protein [Feifania hominis]|uniref:tRNA 2-thiocytidine(32) synthetase TtcA n=1 Tax=Feifania hominis TaxID=2763660 RepID=A0A926DGE0_9FIRM|nr:ATP-binding protein [Feifania hominis]MBC8536565.1 tRNA 2-thiocytidine(32) synthetase TtcA [Feifania hominis]